MSKKKGKSKIRTDFRKRYNTRARKRDFTRDYNDPSGKVEDTSQTERVSGKGQLSRKRTIITAETVDEEGATQIQLDVNEEECLKGRVISVHGLNSMIRTNDGREFQATIRGILKTLSSDLQNIVVVGDHVMIKPLSADQAVIERVDPRRGCISRTSRGKHQILVSNVDCVIIVGSAAEPHLKPNLIDRMLVSADRSHIKPVICINKVDLIDISELQSVIGQWGQLAYEIHLISAATGFGIERLRNRLKFKDSVVCGQSGVGKSSILNAVYPELDLRTAHVSHESQKGRHTTTAARLIPMPDGGYIIDTPGIRQFQLWDVIPEEVGGYFKDIRPWINFCRFPNCTHTHESDCGVKDAVADGKLSARRYESYCQIRES